MNPVGRLYDRPMLRSRLAALVLIAAAAAATARAEPPGAVEQADDAEIAPLDEQKDGKTPAVGERDANIAKARAAAEDKQRAAALKLERGDDDAPAPAANETYKGVARGGANLPPRAPRLPLKKGPRRLTWSGFHVKDGVPTVFLELTGPPDYRVDESAGSVVVTLKNTVAPLRNNRRPLKVEYFNTSVKEVDTHEKGRDLEVTIHTAGADKPSHKERVEPAAGGFQLLVIEIGAAQ